MTVKFVYNGIKVDGKFYKAFYHVGKYTKESGLAEGTITVSLDTYEKIPRACGLNIKNESDSQSDYFETDLIRIQPADKFYADAKSCLIQQIERRIKRAENRIARKIANGTNELTIRCEKISLSYMQEELEKAKAA